MDLRIFRSDCARCCAMYGVKESSQLWLYNERDPPSSEGGALKVSTSGSKQAAHARSQPSSKGISKYKCLSSNMHGLPSLSPVLHVTLLPVKGFSRIKHD